MQNPVLFQHFLRLILTIVLVGAPLVISAQSAERQTIKTEIINVGMKKANSRFMSSGGEDCAQHKPNMWSRHHARDFQKWELEPVPLETVRRVGRNIKHPENIYRVLSAKDPTCEYKYLSAPANCKERYVDLWKADENKMQQWWYIDNITAEEPPLPNTRVVTITNVYRHHNCGVKATLLSTRTTGGKVDLWFRHDITASQKWIIEFRDSRRPPLRIGKAKGSWQIACEGGQQCNNEFEKSLDLGEVSEKSWTKEVQNSVAVTVEAGVEFGVASSSVSVTGSHQETSGEAGGIARSRAKSFSDKCNQPVNMSDFNIHAVWQWVVTTPVQNTRVTIKTCTVACTPNRVAPNYAPGAPQHIRSCSKKW